nr:retrovirus-related Pol polyprotein from transposon TNT 1-94 [Tanacetum cinerariifolium]
MMKFFYHKLFDILKQYQKEVYKLHAERLARNANPLALVATAQANKESYYQTSKSQKSYAPSSKPSIPNSSHTTTKYKGKEISKPITPPSESASEEDSDPEQAQRDKDMHKNLSLIAKYFKKIYKPTNNNLRFSSNSRNKNVDTTPWYKNDNQSGQFGSQRMMNVAGAREIKTKRVNDSAYHKEKMLLCKQAEKGVPLQAEQYDWLADTDKEIDEQELEAHYSYMAKIQEVPTADSVTDSEPLEQNDQNDVESDDEHVALANLIANLKLDVDENKKIQKQLKKANTTLAQELKECKTIPAETSKTLRESNSVRDSCLVALQNKQTEFEKYKAFNDRTVDHDKLERKLNETLGQLAQKDIEIKEGLKLKAYEISVVKEKHDELIKQSLLTKSHYEGRVKQKTKQEMHADLKYVESLKKEIDELESDKAEFSNMYDMILQECVSNEVMCTYLLSLSDLDALAELQCLYLHKVKECDCLAQKLSKQTESVSKKVYTELLQHFAKLEKHSISLELALQQCKEQIVQLILFIVDSRCTKHMTDNLKLLCNFVEKYLESTSSSPLCLMAKASPTQAWLWHRRLSHLNFDYINLLSKKDVVIGLPKLKYVKDQLCSSCEVSKAKRSSFKSKVVPSSKGRLNLLHMDLCGPMRVASINGNKCILVIIDDYSRYTWTLFLRSKDETPEVLKESLTMIQRNLQAPVITVRTDRGTEFLNKTLHAFFIEEGIEHQTSTARTPEQNDIVERRNRTLVEASRTMLSASKLPLFFWVEVIATACYTQNRSIIIPTHDKTAYHIINDRKPSIKHLHIFSCICYLTRDGENLDKMKEKGDPCILVGYSTQSKGYRIYNKRTGLIVESIHIRFDKIKEIYFKCQKSSSPSNNSNPQDTQPTTNIQPTSEPSTPTYVHAEINNVNQAEEEHFQDDEFTNPFFTPVQEVAESSSHNIGNSNVHTFNQPQVFEYRWTKDHPLEQVRGNPSKPVQTRRQMATDPEMCMFALTVSTAEPKNTKEAMVDSAWIEASRKNFISLTDFRSGNSLTNHLARLTEYQLADMFIKALPEDRFKYLVRRIGMRCLTPAELEVLAKESA